MDITFPTNLRRRDVLDETTPFLAEEGVILLLGARQTGKTSLLYLLIQELLKQGVPPSQIVYFDLENISNFNQLSDLTDFNEFLPILKNLKVDTEKRAFVFVDEIQHLDNPSSFLKYLHDHYKPRLKFVVTGSSSLEVKKKFTDSLTGRIYRFLVKPLDFKEFLEFKDEAELAQKIADLDLPSLTSHNDWEEMFREITTVEGRTLQNLLEEYLVFGGYPAISLLDNVLVKQKTLQEIYSLYIRRDIKDIGEIEDVRGYNKLATLLSHQIGNLVKEQELAVSSGLSRPTVNKYLFLLESTFILELVSPFYSNKRTELTKVPKVYFADVGLRNSVIDNFGLIGGRADRGQLLENFAYSQLDRKAGLSEKVRFWRTQSKNEVDFVWQEKTGTPYPLEVKLKFSSKQPLPAGLKSFIKRYRPPRAFIVHNGPLGSVDYQGCTVLVLPAWAI
jgi:predicted AAA+ superfamily ATPase